MNDRPHEWHWLDQSVVLSVEELSRCCGIPPQDIEELISYRALEHVDPAEGPRVFSGEWVGPLRTAARLRRDYDLDLFSVAMLLDYLRRIDSLEREVRQLRAQLPSHAAPKPHEPGRWREEHGSARTATG